MRKRWEKLSRELGKKISQSGELRKSLGHDELEDLTEVRPIFLACAFTLNAY